VRYDPELSQVGFQFEKEFPQAEELFSASAPAPSDTGTGGPKYDVPAPKLNPFPAITGAREFCFTGVSPSAEMVLVRNGLDEFRVPVHDGRFEVDVTLGADRSNFLSFAALRAGGRSIPPPVCIVHRTGAADSASVP